MGKQIKKDAKRFIKQIVHKTKPNAELRYCTWLLALFGGIFTSLYKITHQDSFFYFSIFSSFSVACLMLLKYNAIFKNPRWKSEPPEDSKEWVRIKAASFGYRFELTINNFYSECLVAHTKLLSRRLFLKKVILLIHAGFFITKLAVDALYTDKAWVGLCGFSLLCVLLVITYANGIFHPVYPYINVLLKEIKAANQSPKPIVQALLSQNAVTLVNEILIKTHQKFSFSFLMCLLCLLCGLTMTLFQIWGNDGVFFLLIAGFLALIMAITLFKWNTVFGQPYKTDEPGNRLKEWVHSRVSEFGYSQPETASLFHRECLVVYFQLMRQRDRKQKLIIVIFVILALLMIGIDLLLVFVKNKPINLDGWVNVAFFVAFIVNIITGYRLGALRPLSPHLRDLIDEIPLLQNINQRA